MRKQRVNGCSAVFYTMPGYGDHFVKTLARFLIMNNIVFFRNEKHFSVEIKDDPDYGC